MLSNHVNSDRVSRETLKGLPEPQGTTTFKPVHHYDLVQMLDRTLRAQGISIQEEQLALRKDGQTLFGVMKLLWGHTEDGQAALGFRNGNDRTLSIQLCAGLTVFVCDNMVFRGDMIALARRHTSGLNLQQEIEGAVQKFKDHFSILQGEIGDLKAKELQDIEAKGIIHDAFVSGLMPIRFMPWVSRNYFEPTHPEFESRNAWSLHNAFTEEAKKMPLTTRVPAIQEVGRMFGLFQSPKEAKHDGSPKWEFD